MQTNSSEMTKKLLFGQTDTPFDPNVLIRKNGVPSPIQSYSMIDYLTTGAGRYARPSSVDAISKFFADAQSAQKVLKPNVYSLSDIQNLLSASSSTNIYVSQYTTDISSDDYDVRTYLFGSTSFSVGGASDNEIQFIVNEMGEYLIEGMTLIAEEDNFDFQSDNLIASAANVALNRILNPYDIIPYIVEDGSVTSFTVPVDIKFQGPGIEYLSYSLQDFLTDRNKTAFEQIVAPFSLINEAIKHVLGVGLVSKMQRADPALRYEASDGKKLIFGTHESESLDYTSADVDLKPSQGVVIAAGDGDDRLIGTAFDDELWGSNGNDYIQAAPSWILNQSAPLTFNSMNYVSSGNGDDTVAIGRENNIVDLGNGKDVVHFYGNQIERTTFGDTKTSVVWGGAGADEFHFLDRNPWDAVFVYDPGITSELLKNVDLESFSAAVRAKTGMNANYIIINPEKDDKIFRYDGLQLEYEVRSGERQYTLDNELDPVIETGRVTEDGSTIRKYATWEESTYYSKYKYYSLVGDERDFEEAYTGTPFMTSGNGAEFAAMFVGENAYDLHRLAGVTDGAAGISFATKTYLTDEEVVARYYKLNGYLEVDQAARERNGDSPYYKTPEYSPFNPAPELEGGRVAASPVEGDSRQIIYDDENTVGDLNRYAPQVGSVGSFLGKVSSRGLSDKQIQELFDPSYASASQIEISLRDYQKAPTSPDPDDEDAGSDGNGSGGGEGGPGSGGGGPGGGGSGPETNQPGQDIRGSIGDDTLAGSGGNDTITGGAGDDQIVNLFGSNEFRYSSGDGDDIILARAQNASDTNQLNLSDIEFGQASLKRDGVDLLLEFAEGGGSVQILRQFIEGNTRWGIDTIEFANGRFVRRDEIADAIDGTGSEDPSIWRGNADTYTTTAGTAIELSLLANDQIPAGQDYAYYIWTQPQNGSLQWNGNEYVYTPNQGFTGTDTFTYGIHNSTGEAMTSPDGIGVTINVQLASGTGTPGPNPNTWVGNADTYTTTAGTAIELSLLANDQIPAGQDYAYYIWTQPQNGSLQWNGNEYVYTPNQGFTGTDTFTYGIHNSTGEAMTSPDGIGVTINVQLASGTGTPGPNPNTWVGNADTYTTTASTAIELSLLANDQIPAGQDYAYYIWTQPQNGSLQWNGNEYVYTPNQGFTGTDTFTYGIHNSTGEAMTSPDGIGVTINVQLASGTGTPGPNPNTWVGNADTYTTTASTAIELSLLANDQIPAGQDYAYYIWTQPQNGSLQWNGNEYVYTPNQGFTGTDTFTYGIHNSTGEAMTSPDGIGVTINVQLASGNSVFGTAGADSLIGSEAGDVLHGRGGDDTITGGAGNDTFLFDPGFGKDVITDFTAGAGSVDVIQFNSSIFASYSAVYAAAAQSGADVVITVDSANTLTLKNVALSSLHADDFRFV